jgi:hypothetical protein
MKRLQHSLALVLAFLCLCFSARAETITATLTFTNLATNHHAITVTGNTRQYTNDVSSSPSTLIYTTNSANASATNYFNHVGAYGYGGGITIRMTETNEVVLIGDESLTVSVTAGFASLVLNTQANTARFAMYGAYDSLQETNRTNQASQIAYGMKYATSAIPAGITAMQNYMDMSSTAQTNANKTADTWFFLKPTGYEGIYTNSVWVHATNGLIHRLQVYEMTGTTTGDVHFAHIPRLAYSNTFTGTNFFQRLVIPSGGGIAIGATSPAPTFVNGVTVDGHGSFPTYQLNAYGSSVNPQLLFSRYRGDVSAPTNLVAGNVIGILEWFGARTNDSSVRTAFRLAATALEDFNLTNSVSLISLGVGRRNPSGAQYRNVMHLTFLNITNDANVYNNSNVVVSGKVNAGSYEDNAFTGTNRFYGAVSYTATNVTGLVNSPTVNTVDVGSRRTVVLSGNTAAANINYITGGNDGREVVLIKTNQFSLTIANESNLGGAITDRIVTGTGADVTFTNLQLALRFTYVEAMGRWYLELPR